MEGVSVYDASWKKLSRKIKSFAVCIIDFKHADIYN